MSSGVRKLSRASGWATGIGCLALVAGLATPLGMSHAAPANWKTGSAFEKQWQTPFGVRWSGQELRTALNHLGEAQQVAMFLDRRVDPGQPVELQLSDVALAAGLRKLADQQDLGLSVLGDVVYVGPKEAALDLRTLATLAKEEADEAPAEQRKVLFSAAPLSWPELARPRDLIADQVQKAGLKIVGLDRVPHDLWPAGSWPAMGLIDRLTLLAIGFDLQLRVSKDGTAVALVPRTTPARLVREYQAGVKAAELSKKFAEYFPDAQFKTAGNKLFMRARLEDHDRVQAALRGEPLTRTEPVPASPSPNATAGTKIFTLTVQNKPLQPVLQALAKQMGLKLTIDEAAIRAANIDLEQLVSFQVKEAQAPELWRAVLAPAGLTFVLENDELRVFPAIEPAKQP